MPRRDLQDRVAVRRCAYEKLGCDGRIGAAAFLDDDRLADLLGELLAKQARDDVVRAPGGKSDDHAGNPAGN